MNPFNITPDSIYIWDSERNSCILLTIPAQGHVWFWKPALDKSTPKLISWDYVQDNIYLFGDPPDKVTYALAEQIYQFNLVRKLNPMQEAIFFNALLNIWDKGRLVEEFHLHRRTVNDRLRVLRKNPFKVVVMAVRGELSYSVARDLAVLPPEVVSRTELALELRDRTARKAHRVIKSLKNKLEV